MASRETFSIRLSTDEKAAVVSRAESYNMSLGEYVRYAALNAPPPVSTTPTTSPPYETLAMMVQTHEATLNQLASTSGTVASALDQARAALGPRKEQA